MITREEFEKLSLIKSDIKVRDGVPARVYRLLLENKDRAYTSGDIHRIIHVKQHQIIDALKALEKRGYVRHNKPYWIIIEDKEEKRIGYP